jgi:hypothetical protein
MKKIPAVLLAALLITALLSSCSGASKDTAASAPMAAPSYGYNESSAYDDETYFQSEAENVELGGGSAGESAALTEGNAVPMTEKIIYSFYADIETTEFDKTLEDVAKLMGQFGAFIESSSVSGSSYYGNTTYRTANYTIRVPVQSFASLTGSLDVLGNVVNQSTTADNITTQFIDTQARLDTYETEEERLLAMLEKAETVEDMITIESRLSDVRYQIESLTSTLRNWQNQVDYSTVTLFIEEVEELSDQLPAQRTYWDRMWDGLNSTFEGIGDFFKSLLLFLVVAMPVLIILAVIAIVVVIIVRSSKKRKLKKQGGTNEPKQ